jgi:uncharacterized membrane protein
MSSAPVRRGYLDWLRGVAVLIMIEAHMFDSWTRFPDNRSREFEYAMVLGGFGAPLFLFLAGVIVPLSAGSKLRRSGDRGRAWRTVARRGLEIFGLALLFRVQAWILGWANPGDLLKVDILNIMGPSMIAAAGLWSMHRSAAGRALIFGAATTLVVVLTPFVRAWPALGSLPDPLEAYLRPTAALSNFTFFPWSAFVLGGALVGAALDSARSVDQERHLNLAFAACGAALAAVAYRASFHSSVLPESFPPTSFWTTSASFFFIRIGLLIAAVGVAWAWESRPAAARWSPLRQLGRTSLFIYWIHVEMIYGVVAYYLRKSISWGTTWMYYALFIAFMLACSIAKDRVVEWWRNRGAAIRSASPSSDQLLRLGAPE